MEERGLVPAACLAYGNLASPGGSDAFHLHRNFPILPQIIIINGIIKTTLTSLIRSLKRACR